MDIEQMRRLITCPECGKRRVYFVTSAICPDGHGRMLISSRRKFNSYVRRVESFDSLMALPVCTKTPKGFFVDCKKYVRTKKDESDVAARIEGKKGWRRIYLKDGTKVKSESEAGSTCSVT